MNASAQARVLSCLLLMTVPVITGRVAGQSTPVPVVASEPVGLVQVTINPGPNLITAPLHCLAAYRVLVEAAGGSGLTNAGNPGWTVDQFAPKDGFTQFIVILRKSSVPAHEGEWWPVLANDSFHLTVDNRGEDLRSLVQAGDSIEIRHLTSLKDLFGTGSTFALNKDSNGSPNETQEDLIRFLEGTGFATTIFYHGGDRGPEGYYASGRGPLDGSTITVFPDQPFMVFRRPGSAVLKITCRGQAQMTRLAHYLRPGANIVGSPFPVDSPICTSGLAEAGWRSDSDGAPNAAQEDILRPIVGVGFGPMVFHHDGHRAPAGWYVSGARNDQFPIEPAKGYVLFLQGDESFIWNQPPPYTP